MHSRDPTRQRLIPQTTTKATPERFDKIVEALAEGHSIESAAALASINRRTLQRWMKRAAEEEDDGGVFAEFLNRCEIARAKFEASRVDIIRKAGDKGEWTAAAWWLERVEPQRYGRRTVTHHAGPMTPKDFTVTIAGAVDPAQLTEAPRELPPPREATSDG
jgi:hypothetical protein